MARRSTITHGVSAFAEYATVSRSSVVRIDDELPLKEAALFGCAGLTGAVIDTGHVSPAGASGAVIRLGGVGLCSVLAALAARARWSLWTSPTRGDQRY
jgi:alcohol dehydrogenase